MEVTTPSTSESQTDLPRDADRLPADAWPARPLPPTVQGREARFQVVFADAVLHDIRAHGLSSPDAEVCGVLVGNIFRDDLGLYCDIHANIRGNHAAGRNAQVTFTADTWTHIQQTMDSLYPDDRIVGWYHTHPGFGIFLSEMDVFIHENFFGEPWQVAYVDDPQGGDRGVFVWENNIPARRPHLIAPSSAEAVADASTSSPLFATQPQAVSTPIDSLTAAARARTLQRELAEARPASGRIFLILAFLVPIAAAIFLYWRELLHYFLADLP
jgi:proteasome lid subunit RPN8/RPN11